MAIQTRYAGDALPVLNVDAGLSSPAASTGTIIATGLTKTPVAVKVLLGNSQNFGSAEMATGGAVETILRAIGQDSTIVMYQVEATGGQLSVLLEATGAGGSTGASSQGAASVSASTIAAALQTRLQSVAGNVGISANVYLGGGVTVTSAGYKLA